MKLVMTLLARDEADIVDAQLAYHLSAGVDFVVATDNRSSDGTTEILERYQRAGLLHLIRESGDDMRQAEWVTRMARLAAGEFEADWVINADADEFWWPRGGSLPETLATVPSRYGVVRGCWRHFPPRPEDGEPFFERMTVRLCTPASPGNKTTIFHAHQKVAHRATPNVVVEPGNHNATGTGLDPMRSWQPLEVLHLSLRSSQQVRRKGRGGWLRNPDYEPTEHEIRLTEASRSGSVDAFFLAHVVGDEELARGLADGTYAIDTRLRDRLRLLRAPDGTFSAERIAFGPATVAESAAYANEASMLVEIDAIVRAERRVEALETRLRALGRDRRRLAPR